MTSAAPLRRLIFVGTLAGSFLAAAPMAESTSPSRWTLATDGGITWNVPSGDTHHDHIEMSGEQVSVIVTYGVDSGGAPHLGRHVVWPMLRFQPNRTRDHLALTFGADAEPRLFFDRAAPRDVVTERIHHLGLTTLEGTIGRNRELSFQRVVFPSTDKPIVIDRTTLTNRSAKPVTVEIEDNTRTVRTQAERGIYGGYLAQAAILGAGEHVLSPGQTLTYAVVLSARKAAEPPPSIDPGAEEAARRARVASLLAPLQLETPDPVLNTAFAFAKIRAAESIFRTKGGLMHAPGGGAYYAAVWANDQAEYANPFFPFLGDAIANESAINAFRHFARWMNPEYQPIPSSIIAEGDGFWHGAKDRGDMAMIAYGIGRFALARGDRTIAAELWPLLEWCLEYSRRQTNAAGVIASDSDELENRFPAGKANLCTSSLHYDALLSAVLLGRELGKPSSQLDAYAAEAETLRTAIERHFGAKVEGYDTYRYFDRADLVDHPRHAAYATKPDLLRAWICIPLTVGIYDRAAGTIDALFSPRLWTVDGLATQAGEITFWDRSTLYALRGVFAAGATQRALDYLTYYSNRRLLGEHVPYPVEAYPEGNQRHLAAESALYCRIYTEGLFGLRPTGFRSFTLTPRLPEAWERMALRRIKAFGGDFDLVVARHGKNLTVTLAPQDRPPQTTTVAVGETIDLRL